jgi:hypothetical protein
VPMTANSLWLRGGAFEPARASPNKAGSKRLVTRMASGILMTHLQRQPMGFSARADLRPSAALSFITHFRRGARVSGEEPFGLAKEQESLPILGHIVTMELCPASSLLWGSGTESWA